MVAGPTPTRVLVVDDEPPIRRVVRAFLERDGMTIAEAADGPAAVEAARRFHPDVVVLDILLPGFDGLEVLRRIRAFSDPLVLFLTARAEEEDRVVGLRVGGDDYLVKPFSPRELAARVHALARRRRADPAPDQGGVVRVGDLLVDSRRHSVISGGAHVELTALEFALLEALARDPGVVLSRQQLLDAAWGEDLVGDEHVVEVHIANLRRKLGDEAGAARRVETVRGIGYRLRDVPA